MRYCFFAAQYLPTTGGVERFTCNLARRMIAAGHSVCVVTSALPGLPDYEVDECGVEILRMPSLLLLGGRFPVIRPGRAFARQAKRLWDHAFDFCLINTYFYPLSLYAAWQTHRRHIPAITVNHGTAWLMTGAPPVALAGRLYEHLAARWVRHFCPRFYGVSQACCDWVRHFGIQAEGVLTNAVDPEEVQRTARQGEADWRGRLGLAPDTPLIAFVGRMVPEKGVASLEAALPAIRAAVPGTALVMAGGGPLLASVQARQTEGLYAVGSLPYADTLSLLAQAQVFCLPTRSEGFACTVLEAAALDCPIITTATGGSPQLLPDESYGLLLPDMSAQQTADACIRALRDPAWRRTAAQKARRRLEENYTWSRAAAALDRISKGAVT